VGAPTRMRSNAVGGGTRTLCLAWEVAIMMPLQEHFSSLIALIHPHFTYSAVISAIQLHSDLVFGIAFPVDLYSGPNLFPLISSFLRIK
jgi:hypothetical protein